MTEERPGPPFQAFKESIANPAQLRFEAGPRPPQTDVQRLSIPPAARTGAGRPVEPIPSPSPISNPAAVPKYGEDATAWSLPPSPKPGTESIPALGQDSRVIAVQLKSEPEAVVAPRSPDTPAQQPDPAVKTNNPLPVTPRIVHRPNSVPESGISQPEVKESKTEPAGKREFPVAQLNNPHVEVNATALETAARPTDIAGAPETRISRPLVAEAQAMKVASEPEIKVGIPPPPTRQISLRLSADDSSRVTVDLIQKAGKVQVAVRTLDQELAKSLQTDLGDLVGRLESKGFKTETWVPTPAHHVATLSQRSNSNGGFDQSQHSGSGQGGGQERQQQNGSNQRQQARWTAQIEEKLSANEARSESQ